MATIPENYADAGTLSDKIVYVLSLMQKGSADELAMEITELDGIASKEGVAEVTIETERELERLCAEGMVEKIKEHRQKKRYILTA